MPPLHQWFSSVVSQKVFRCALGDWNTAVENSSSEFGAVVLGKLSIVTNGLACPSSSPRQWVTIDSCPKNAVTESGSVTQKPEVTSQVEKAVEGAMRGKKHIENCCFTAAVSKLETAAARESTPTQTARGTAKDPQLHPPGDFVVSRIWWNNTDYMESAFHTRRSKWWQDLAHGLEFGAHYSTPRAEPNNRSRAPPQITQ